MPANGKPASCGSTDETVRVSLFAMATRFEILLHGGDPLFLRSAGEEALREIKRLENQLNIFQPESPLSRINQNAAHKPQRIGADLFRLIQHSKTLWQKTGGAFDITIGPLMHCWGFRSENKPEPTPGEIAAAHAKTGFQFVRLNPENRTIFFERNGLTLDLGSVAKGWALDEAALILREEGVENALLHGGTSTTIAIGNAPGKNGDGWKIAIAPPPPEVMPGTKPWPEPFLTTIILRNEALSVSGIGGRFLRRGDSIHGHLIDPRTGQPTHHSLLAAITHPVATDTDALSTGLMIGGTELLEKLTEEIPESRMLLLHQNQNNELNLIRSRL